MTPSIMNEKVNGHKIDQANKDRRILIVDDEPYNIMGLKVQLMQAGFDGIEDVIEQAYCG